jgi:hypothetical protein
MTSFSFFFQTPFFKPQGAILELIFPQDLPISQLSINQVSGISKLEPVINYTVNGLIIRMSNAISQFYTSSDVHYFRISSIQNPVILF